MSTAPPPSPDLARLAWQSEGGLQIATDGNCLYMREGPASMIAGMVFASLLAVGLAAGGAWALLTETSFMARGVAGVLFLLSGVFVYVLVSTSRRGRWIVVYDRGHPGFAGEVRYQGKRLSASRIRGFSTRPGGGSISMPRRTVVAELHDGTCEALGPNEVSTWPDHWGQKVATWMNLPFRFTRE